MSPKPDDFALTTQELIEIAIEEVLSNRDEYSRNFLVRMAAGEKPSEWDYMAAMVKK